MKRRSKRNDDDTYEVVQNSIYIHSYRGISATAISSLSTLMLWNIIRGKLNDAYRSIWKQLQFVCSPFEDVIGGFDSVFQAA
mmetsp:Transcript_25326/g.70941  ORF Transcript_25326/g.70941 Transcript_25326/m.70941 type:complete len:82 (+) Transcript_25326:87-332(+)